MNKPARRRAVPAKAAPSLLSLLREVGRSIEGRLEAELGKEGLSGAKAWTLEALAEAPEPLPLSRLAQENACVRSNITQLVDRLESDGLVRRVSDPDDRRVRRAALTTPGRRARREASRVITRQERAVADLFTGEEAEQLRRLLGRLLAR